MTLLNQFIMILSLSLLSLSAQAEIVKCIDIEGNTEYTKPPCSDSSEDVMTQELTTDSQIMIYSNSGVDNQQSTFAGESVSKLVFQEIQLQSVMQLLADFANKKLEFAPNIADKRIPISYMSPTPWDQIVHELSVKHQFNYRITESSLIIESRKLSDRNSHNNVSMAIRDQS